MASVQTFLAFAETAKHGGFAAAARSMGLSPSAVAKAVGRLEADLGLRLFNRTTRQVRLTSEGHELYGRCRRIVDEIEALRDDASSSRSEPRGILRLDVPAVLGRTLVVPSLAILVRKYPKIALEIGFSDRYVDLVEEGLDAVVRIGHLRDSTLVARVLGHQVLVTCGSPKYLEKKKTPRSPVDLEKHVCLVFRDPSSGRARPWQFQEALKATEHSPPSTIVMNDGEALVSAAAESLGLIQVPDYMAMQELQAGRLVEVLKRFRPPPVPISLVYPSTRRVTPKLRVLTEVLIEAAKGKGFGLG